MKYLAPSERRAFQDIQENTWDAVVANEIRAGVAILRESHAVNGTRGRYTRMTGFTAGMEQMRVASIPPEVFFNLERVDPEIVRDKTKFYAWLNQYGQEYDTRRKVD